MMRCLFSTFVLVGLLPVQGLSAETPPNILWFIGDDIGPLELGCYGHPNIKTPNVDRLASVGVRYTNAFVTISSCSPSRVTMFTGKYPHATGAENLHDPLPADQRVLPQMLRRKNYFSAICGKFHLGAATVPKFDVVKPKVGYWKTVLESRPPDRPFFLSVSFFDAHRPFDRGCVKPPTRPEDVILPPYIPDVPEARAEYAGFYDEIRRMDAVIGEVLGWIEEQGLSENTLVIFFGDNGPPFPRDKTTLFDSGIRTPLLVRWPARIKTDFVSLAQFSTVDLVPTCLAAAGLDIPADVQGKNLIDTFTDPAARGREFVFAERNWHDFEDHSRAVRTTHFKYIRNAFPERPLLYSADSITQPLFQKMRKMRDAATLSPNQMLLFRAYRSAEELYDLRVDPNELRNIVGDPAYQPVLQRMRKALDEWIERTGDIAPEPALLDMFDPETGKRIRSLKQVKKR